MSIDIEEQSLIYNMDIVSTSIWAIITIAEPDPNTDGITLDELIDADACMLLPSSQMRCR